MKKMLFVFLLCASSLVYAGETGWYFGYGVGKTNLKYDTNAAIDESIKKQGYDIPVDILTQRGHPLVFTSNLSSYTGYWIIGYRLSQLWSIEAQSGDLGTFKVNGDFHLKESGTAFPLSYPINSYVNADAVGTAILSKTSFTTLSALYTISDSRLVEPYLRIGVGYLEGKLNTQYQYTYSYGATSEGADPVNYSGSFKEAQSDTYGVPIGVVGIGLRVNLNKKTEARFEFQRVGFVVKDPSVDMYTVQLVRLF